MPRPFWVLLSLVVLAGIIYWTLQTPEPAWVEENYSRRLYPLITAVLVPIFNLTEIPLSFSAALVLVAFIILTLIWRFLQRKSLRGWLGYWFPRYTMLGIFIYGFFLFNWGVNYQRQSIETLFSLQPAPVTQTDVEGLMADLEPILRAYDHQDRDVDAAISNVRSALEQTVNDLTGTRPVLPNLKRIPEGMLIRWGSASGVISPITLEAHIDAALAPVEQVSIGAHELAHVAGFAGEADADFVSLVAGLKPDNAAFVRYAAALRLWDDAVRQLPEEARASHYQALPARVRDDINATNAAYQTHLSPRWLRNLQNLSYDQYLRSQGVEDGIDDYSRSVNLMVSAHKQGLLDLSSSLQPAQFDFNETP